MERKKNINNITLISLGIAFIIVINLIFLAINRKFKASLTEAKFSQVSTIRTGLENHINDYLDNSHNYLLTIAESPLTKSAILDFSTAFNELKSKEISSKSTDELVGFYDSKFLPLINYDKPRSSLKKLPSRYLPLTNSGKILQRDYILNNHFKLGHKNRLLSPIDSRNSYDEVHIKYHNYFDNAVEKFDYYDIFLVSKDGSVVYSTFKELDFGTNLLFGPFNEQGLGINFNKVRRINEGEVYFEDFRPYEPSYNKSEGFLGTPIFDGDEFIGALIIQISLERLESILGYYYEKESAELGKTGEIFLVGSDSYMKTNSRFINSINSPIVQKLGSTVNILTFNKDSLIKIAGINEGKETLKDYKDTHVISAYTTINFFNEKYRLFVNISEKEVAADINAITRKAMFLTMLIITAITGLLLYLYQKYIVKPMEYINDLLVTDNAEKSNELIQGLQLLNQYKKAVDASAAVSKIDLDGNILYTNKEYSLISGYNEEDLIGKHFTILMHPSFSSNIINDIWKTINNKRIWRGEIRNIKKDGDEYYTKNTIIPILDNESTITEFMLLKEDVTELKNKEKLIQKHTTDKLTGLGNKQLLNEHLQNLHLKKLGIINIEKFHIFNDYYGQDIGDLIIIEVGKLLTSYFKKYNINIYRIFADEFAILETKNQLSKEEFIKLCSSFIDLIANRNIDIRGNELHINVNIGISEAVKDAALIEANIALNKAKELNKKLSIYTIEMLKEYQQNIEMTKIIKKAIKNNKLIVYAQPILDNITNKINKYECLIRLQLPDGKILSPYFFLDTSKKIKLYPLLTQTLIEKSFRYFSNKDCYFSINFTIEDILNVNTVEYLKERIIYYGIGKKLIIEIVESEEVENIKLVEDFINEVKSFGCKVAIDDFGTGYSNFKYLLTLNADYIKIDGSLIRDIDTDIVSREITGAIVGIAKKLELQIIAEYVSNDKVLEIVKEMGIDFSQGYHISEPKALGKEYQN